MKAFLILTMAGTTLTGCKSIESGGSIGSGPRNIVDSVAQQIMGEGAISIYPFSRQEISVPGIYAVRTNEQSGRHSYIEICPIDMTIPAIANMEVTQRSSSRTFRDSLEARSINVSTPFLAAKTRYTMQSINGYAAETVKSGGSTDAADWILENVGDKCRNEVLPRNGAYFVAVGVATSNNIDVERGGGIEVLPFNIGIANIEVVLSDQGSRIINDERPFALVGKLYSGGIVSSHGSY